MSTVTLPDAAAPATIARPPGHRRPRQRSESILTTAGVLFFVIIVLFPVVWTLGAAVSPNTTGWPDPTHLQPGNFAVAFEQADLGHALLASTVITASAVAIQVLLAIGSGYAFGVLNVIGSKIIFPIVLLGMMLSIEALIVPLYYTFRDLGLTDSWLGVVIVHVGMGVPFGAFWMRATFRAVPKSMIESAQIDGASSWRALWSILVPVSKPAILTLILLNVMWTWNDYFVALIVIADPAKQPVTLALGAFQGRYTTEFNLMAAAAVIICLPVLILYAIFQRQFINGVLAGAIKE